MSIKKIRFQQLSHILESEYDNNRKKLAQKLNISLFTLNKYLSKGKNRPISNKTARQFEIMLGKEKEFLDHASHTSVYYVMVWFTGRHPGEFLDYLYHHEIVKEASALHGDADILIKIEALEEEYQALVFHNIRLFPGVTHTTTSQAFNSLRWQRQQIKYRQQMKEKKSSHNILQNFIDVKRQELYAELSELDKGKKITIHKHDFNALEYCKLFENAKNSIQMILFYNDATAKKIEEDFFKSKNKITAEVKYKILLLTKDLIASKNKDMHERFFAKLKQDSNIELEMMDERDWIGARHEPTGITLTIIDDTISSILEGKYFRLAYDEDVVNRYIRLFKKNWNSAKEDGKLF